MMEVLWQSWTHLGVDKETKISRIRELVHIEKEFHRDVISETRQKIKIMEETINSEFLMLVASYQIYNTNGHNIQLMKVNASQQNKILKLTLINKT